MAVLPVHRRTPRGVELRGVMVERTASCLCGQLRVTVSGDPDRVNMCNCQECQRRSGSAFQIGALFDKAKLKAIEGDSNTYTRTAESGRSVELHFCPSCGVAVYFFAEVRPAWIGVHGGCFADPEFPAPNVVLWTEQKHHWLTLPDVEMTFDQQAP